MRSHNLMFLSIEFFSPSKNHLCITHLFSRCHKYTHRSKIVHVLYSAINNVKWSNIMLHLTTCFCYFLYFFFFNLSQSLPRTWFSSQPEITPSVGGKKIKAIIVIVSLLASWPRREWRYDRVITSYYICAIKLLQTLTGMYQFRHNMLVEWRVE